MGRRSCPAFMLILAVLLAAMPAVAGSRYRLDKGREVALGTTAVVGGFLTWRGAQTLAPLNDADLAGLQTDRLPRYDQFATRWWSPRAATASDLLVTGLTVAPLLLLTGTGEAMSAGEFAAIYAETIALEEVVVGILKTRVQRVRPFAYNLDPTIPEDLKRRRYARRSFPSGHTSRAFASAVFMGEVYAGLYPEREARHWVRAGALGLATATGYLRVRAGAHFPSDVIVGAAIGAVIGWAIPKLHETEDQDRFGDPTNPSPAVPIAFAVRF